MLSPAAVAIDQFVEATIPILFVQEGQVIAVKTLEEFFPRDGLERAFTAVTWEIDPQQSRIAVAAGALDARRMAATLFDPTADRFVIDGCLCGRRCPCGLSHISDRLM